MVSLSWLDPRQSRAGIILLIGIITAGLFIGSFFVTARVVVENPNYGDVTPQLELLWRVIMGIATLGSFYIGLRSLGSDTGGSEGPSTRFHFEGQNHDIDFHLHVDDASPYSDTQDAGSLDLDDETD